jgi:hypothetical protein
MSDPIVKETSWDHPTGEDVHPEMTVTIPYEAAVELIDLLGHLAGLCSNHEPLTDTAIEARPGQIPVGLDSAAAFAARCASLAWALSATTWPVQCAETRR